MFVYCINHQLCYVHKHDKYPALLLKQEMQNPLLLSDLVLIGGLSVFLLLYSFDVMTWISEGVQEPCPVAIQVAYVQHHRQPDYRQYNE